MNNTSLEPRVYKQDLLVLATWNPRVVFGFLVYCASNSCDDSVRLMPRGSKYPLFQDSGPKYHEGYGFWEERP